MFYLSITLLALLLVLVLIGKFYKFKQIRTICESSECIKSSAYLKSSMNLSANPCDDFYTFVCGNWIDSNRNTDSLSYGYSNFAKLKQQLDEDIFRYYSKPVKFYDKEPNSVSKSRTFFETCLNIVNTCKPIIHLLHNLSLPTVPAFINDAKLDTFDWISLNAEVFKKLGLSLFLQASVEINILNNTQHIIAISTTNKASILSNKINDIEEKILKLSNNVNPEFYESYDLFLKEVIRFIMVEDSIAVDTNIERKLSKVSQTILKIDNFFNMVSEIEMDTNKKDDILIMKLGDLDSSLNKALKAKNKNITNVWSTFLKKLLGKHVLINENETILTTTEALKYYEKAVLYIENNKEKMQLWAWWQIVKCLILDSSMDIRFYFQKLMQRFVESEKIFSRKQNCIEYVIKFFEMEVISAIRNRTFELNIKPKINEITLNIQNSFDKLIEDNKWLDNVTKQQIFEKNHHMKKTFGYYNLDFNETLLESRYQEIEINEEKHVENLLKLIEVDIRNQLSNLRSPVNDWLVNSLEEVNAYNALNMNEIIIPSILMKLPFYHQSLQYLNYGAIGSILGHEIIHSFDFHGIEFDKFGNLNNTWSLNSIEKFQNLSECFTSLYDSFHGETYNNKDENDVTLDENVADNVGVLIAYNAFRSFINKHPQSTYHYLPGFSDFTENQMFFISYASIWCDDSTSENEMSLKNDVLSDHESNRIRVRGVTMNSDEFNSAFDCPKRQNYKKCTIW